MAIPHDAPSLTVEITPVVAAAIFEAENVCFSEGVGPSSPEWEAFLKKLEAHFPGAEWIGPRVRPGCANPACDGACSECS